MKNKNPFTQETSTDDNKSSEYKILKKAFEEFSKKEITQSEKCILEELDWILKKAEIISLESGYIVDRSDLIPKILDDDKTYKSKKTITDIWSNIDYQAPQETPDYKILHKAVKEFSKDGFTKSEINSLEKIDQVLKKAELIVLSDDIMAIDIGVPNPPKYFKSDAQREKEARDKRLRLLQ